MHDHETPSSEAPSSETLRSEAPSSDTSIFTRIEGLERDLARLGRALLRSIRALDLCGDWDYGEFRNLEHWVAAHLQISWIDAKRRVEAARAIESLPLISSALESGELSLDKVVQLTRYATPETEAELTAWARGVSLKSVRDAADGAARIELDDVRDNDRLRNLGWRPIEGGAALSLFGALPAEQAALVTRAVDAIASRLPELPHEEIPGLATERAKSLPQRRADALVALAVRALGDGDGTGGSATVIVHAPLAALAGDDVPARLADGGYLHPEVTRRLCCDARIQTVVEDGAQGPIGIGRTSRTVPDWLRRLVTQRDRTCTFPGCEDTTFTEAHHVWHWARGGRTDLDNLVLVCGFHHKAVHEYGWGVARRPDGAVEWFRPSGRLHGVRLPFPRGPALRPFAGACEQPRLLTVT